MELDELAAYVRSQRPVAARKGYPAAVRARVCDAIAAHRRAGVSWARIASRLGISTTTLYRWQSSRSLEDASPFVPVVVEPGRPVICAPSPPLDVAPEVGRQLHLPGGLRVSGLSFEDVVGLARMLV